MWDVIRDVGKALLQWILSLHVPREQKNMLVRTLPSGEIRVISSDQSGEFVRPGDSSHDHHYFNAADRAVQEKGLETLRALVARGWARHDAGILYRLTSTGFRRARRYARKNKG
jgi:hypothetical protein